MRISGGLKKGLDVTRRLSFSVTRGVSTLSIAYETLYVALAKATSRTAVTRVLHEFEKNTLSASYRSQPNGSDASLGQGDRSICDGAAASSTCLEGAANIHIQRNEVETRRRLATIFCDAVLNVIRLKITDVTVWSMLLDHTSQPSLHTDELALRSIYFILCKLDRFTCRNSVVISKVDGIVTTLLERVDALAVNALNHGVIDVKLQPRKFNSTPIPCNTREDVVLKGSSQSVGSGDGGQNLDFEYVWKLWHLLNNSDKLYSSNTENLLLEVLVSRNDEIKSFDLGRTIRTISVLLQRRSSLSVVEENLLRSVFRRLCTLLCRHNSCITENADVVGRDGRFDTNNANSSDMNSLLLPENLDNWRNTVDLGSQSGFTTNSYGMDQSSNFNTVKQGNLYLTIGHVLKIVEMLSSMYRKLSVISFARYISSELSLKGLKGFVSMAETVLRRSLAFEARFSRSGTFSPIPLDDTAPSPCKGIIETHGKILLYMTDVVKAIDHVCYLCNNHSAALSPLQKSVAALGFCMLDNYKMFDVGMYRLYSRCGYYLLLSSLVNGKHSVDEIQKMIFSVLEMMTSIHKAMLEKKEGHDLLCLLIWEDKFFSLLGELAVRSPALQDLLVAHRAVLRSLCENGIDAILNHPGNASTLLRLLQNNGLLSPRILLEYLRDICVDIALWDRSSSDIAMLFDILTRYHSESSLVGKEMCDGASAAPPFCGAYAGTHEIEEHEEVIQYTRQILGSLFDYVERTSPLVLERSNNEQLLSMALCYAAYHDGLHPTLDHEFRRRCNELNFRQSILCMQFASEPLVEMIKRRISNLLIRRGTLVDISPALSALYDNMGTHGFPSGPLFNDGIEGIGEYGSVLHVSQGDRIGLIIKEQRIKLSPEASKWLLKVMLALDRDMRIYNDADYLNRHLERRLHRAIGITSHGAETTKHPCSNILLITSHRECKKFIEMCRFIDDAKESRFYNKLRALI